MPDGDDKWSEPDAYPPRREGRFAALPVASLIGAILLLIAIAGVVGSH
jgi:hypothetical protein